MEGAFFPPFIIYIFSPSMKAIKWKLAMELEVNHGRLHCCRKYNTLDEMNFFLVYCRKLPALKLWVALRPGTILRICPHESASQQES